MYYFYSFNIKYKINIINIYIYTYSISVKLCLLNSSQVEQSKLALLKPKLLQSSAENSVDTIFT